MFYRGKHYKKRFIPFLERVKMQLIFYWTCFKQKVFYICDLWIGWIDKHDAFWDKIEDKIMAFIDKHWYWLGRQIHIIKLILEDFK